MSSLTSGIESLNHAKDLEHYDALRQPKEGRRVGLYSYWLLCFFLIVYVTLCTGFRDNVWGADAWEHQRDVRALARNVFETRNPTYATADRTMRYSPYIVFLGAVCHFTAIDPYTALSIAAVINTLLLGIGLWMLLKSFGEQKCAAAVLLIMVGLYGGAPNHSGSYALADLPWHQVNPSAFAMAMTLVVWATFVRLPEFKRQFFAAAAIIVLGAIILLTHALVGILTVTGMMLISAFAPTPDRLKRIATASCLAVGIVLLSLPWPWYSILGMLRAKPDPTSWDWFNPTIVKMALFQWDAPAILCGLMALALFRRTIVRVFLLSSGVLLAVSVAGLILRSAALGRLPVILVLCLHIPVGVFAYESRLFQPRSWGDRLSALVSPNEKQNLRAILETSVAIVFLYCLLPQVATILDSPHLARAYVAPLLHKEDKQMPLRKIYAQLLAPIHEGDVVLSDPVTMWPVPSYGGRIVYALHNELFVADQATRRADVQAFFTNASDMQRRQILSKYNVQWIILNHDTMDHPVYDPILKPSAVVSRARGMVLMSAKAWLLASEAK